MAENEYEIRKMTPLECWKVMGFSEEDFVAAKVGNREMAKELIAKYEPDHHYELMQYIDQKGVSKMSNSQLYKQAGNSVVVNVLSCIYEELYKAMPYLFEDLTVGSFFSGIGAFENGLDKFFSKICV